MKRRVEVLVPVTKRGLFGIKKTVMKKKIITVDSKTYKKMMKARDRRPYSLDEMVIYDEIFDD